MPAPICKESAQVHGAKAYQPRGTDFLSAISSEKFDQPMRSRDVSADCVRRPAAVVLQIGAPLRGERRGGMN